MPCKVDVDCALKEDILDCSAVARRQIHGFLLRLQENPLPEGRKEADGIYSCELPCGFFVSWEIFGNLLRFVATGETKGISIRILGVGRQPQKRQ